jgi:bacterioferritin-associated ferredoxin
MKTAMQELIETLLSIKSRTPQNLHFEKGLHSAIDSCINEAKSMLEKEKEQIIKTYNHSALHGMLIEIGSEKPVSGQHYYNSTFNTKER